MPDNGLLLELISDLREHLADYRYSEFQVADVPQLGTLYQIMTPRRWMTRYVCAVLEVQDTIANVAQAKVLHERIRSYLFEKYARFPWWKELGTFAVLICSHELYEKAATSPEVFHDTSGLHGNIMLGTVFIDKDKYECYSSETWGLWYSGRHIIDIKRVVRSWCKQSRP